MNLPSVNNTKVLAKACISVQFHCGPGKQQHNNIEGVHSKTLGTRLIVNIFFVVGMINAAGGNFALPA
jgi:hypothetical protein